MPLRYDNKMAASLDNLRDRKKSVYQTSEFSFITNNSDFYMLTLVTKDVGKLLFFLSLLIAKLY